MVPDDDEADDVESRTVRSQVTNIDWSHSSLAGSSGADVVDGCKEMRSVAGDGEEMRSTRGWSRKESGNRGITTPNATRRGRLVPVDKDRPVTTGSSRWILDVWINRWSSDERGCVG